VKQPALYSDIYSKRICPHIRVRECRIIGFRVKSGPVGKYKGIAYAEVGMQFADYLLADRNRVAQPDVPAPDKPNLIDRKSVV
jgi:hypothetical protein